MNRWLAPLFLLLVSLTFAAGDDGSEYGSPADDANITSIQDPLSNTAQFTPSWPRPATKARWGAPSDARRAAWAVVVSNDNLTRHYYDVLLASLECLRQTNSKYEVVLLYEGDLDVEMQTAFKALNVSKVRRSLAFHTSAAITPQQLFRYPDWFVKKGIDISALEEKSAPARDKGHMWYKSWNKLAAWALPKYVQ